MTGREIDIDIEDQRTLTAVLEWYAAMGVDAPLSTEAKCWRSAAPESPGEGFAWPGDRRELAPEVRSDIHPRSSAFPIPAVPPSARAPSPPEQRPGASFAPARPLAPAPAARSRSATTAAASATTLARAAGTLDALGRALASFEGCGLKSTAKSLCFYRGAATAPLMIIGEAPGRDEDIEGKPFVGRAGQLLDRMLAAASFDETNVHITNVVYWRPPGNRTPTPEEAESCRPFLERQIELVAPRIVLLLGGTAAKQVLGTQEGILRVRGTWREIAPNGQKLRAMASLHPAYLLRQPAAKRQAWRDFLAVRDALLNG
ncbi:MAG: uracil-DNA glycosylase [Hyphomicrobium sp.]|nr:uracil-DNA glycosylase [Hyphomicrobium sp.]